MNPTLHLESYATNFLLDMGMRDVNPISGRGFIVVIVQSRKEVTNFLIKLFEAGVTPRDAMPAIELEPSQSAIGWLYNDSDGCIFTIDHVRITDEEYAERSKECFKLHRLHKTQNYLKLADTLLEANNASCQLLIFGGFLRDLIHGQLKHDGRVNLRRFLSDIDPSIVNPSFNDIDCFISGTPKTTTHRWMHDRTGHDIRLPDGDNEFLCLVEDMVSFLEYEKGYIVSYVSSIESYDTRKFTRINVKLMVAEKQRIAGSILDERELSIDFVSRDSHMNDYDVNMLTLNGDHELGTRGNVVLQEAIESIKNRTPKVDGDLVAKRINKMRYILIEWEHLDMQH